VRPASISTRAETRPNVLALEDAPASAVFLADSFYARSFHVLDGLAEQVVGLLRGAGLRQRFRTTRVSIANRNLRWRDASAFMLARPLTLPARRRHGRRRRRLAPEGTSKMPPAASGGRRAAPQPSIR